MIYTADFSNDTSKRPMSNPDSGIESAYIGFINWTGSSKDLTSA